MTMKDCINACVIGAASGFSSAAMGGLFNEAQHDSSTENQDIVYSICVSAGYLLTSIITFYDDCTGEGCLECTGRGCTHCHEAVPFFGCYTLSFAAGAAAGIIVSKNFLPNNDDAETTENTPAPQPMSLTLKYY